MESINKVSSPGDGGLNPGNDHLTENDPYGPDSPAALEGKKMGILMGNEKPRQRKYILSGVFDLGLEGND